MTIRLTERERQAVEEVMDKMRDALIGAGVAMSGTKLGREYAAAVTMVREKPAGFRRLRRDFDTKQTDEVQLEVPQT